MLRTTYFIFAFAQLRGKLRKNSLQGAWKSMFLMKVFKNDTLQKLWASKCAKGFFEIFHHLEYSCEAWKVKGKSYRSGFSVFDTKCHHEIVLNSNFDWFPTSSKLDDPTTMPESALLIATAQIMVEGGAKHSPFSCNTVNSKTDCAASKKAKSGSQTQT